MSRYIDADAAEKLLRAGCAYAIWELPSIDIVPKRGEWMDDDFVGQYRCSECDYYAIDEYDYCPNCGARMKGADDETL